MVQKVHGGILAGTNLTGHLQYIKVALAAVDTNPNVPNSLAEQVYKVIAQKSTVVIVSFASGVMNVAVENAGDGWDKATLEAALDEVTALAAGVVTIGAFSVV